MGLTRYRLGDLIETVDARNVNGITKVLGLNKDKEFMPTAANTESVDLSKYKVVKKGRFAFSGMQTGRDKCIRIGMYDIDSEDAVISPAYTTFEVNTSDVINPTYLFMLFNSKERDRLGWFCSDSSIRSNLDWNRFCDFDLALPPINIQQKYVDIYNAMVANQKCYEDSLEDLKLACQLEIENLRASWPQQKIGNYIVQVNEKNTNEEIILEQGININKEFITPQRPNQSLKGRRIVRQGQFAYCTQLNNENVAIAYRDDEDCVISSVYNVFEIRNRDLCADYLLQWLVRPEFGRYVYWASSGSAYEFLSYESLCDYVIPIPSLEVQQYISCLYRACQTRAKINERMKAQIKNICPILIKGSLEEASKA